LGFVRKLKKTTTKTKEKKNKKSLLNVCCSILLGRKCPKEKEIQ